MIAIDDFQQNWIDEGEYVSHIEESNEFYKISSIKSNNFGFSTNTFYPL